MAELSGTQLGSAQSEDNDVLDSVAAGGLIIRGGILRFASYAAIVGLSILSAALLTRHLGVVRFGEYTTVLSLVGVVAAITDAGMSSVGTREYAVRGGSDRDALMRDLLGLRVTLTLLGVVLTLAFALAAGYGSALLVGALLASLSTVALVIQHTSTIPLTTSLRLGTLSALDLGRQVLTVAALVALIAAGAGLLPLLGVPLLVNLLLIPVAVTLARGQISLRIGLNPRRWLSLLRLTVAFSLATAVGTIYIYTAQIITSLVSSAHESGLFAASFRVFIVAGGVPGLLVAGALPLLARAARDDRERLAYALEKIFEVSLILGVATAIGLLAGAQFIIDVVAGPKFAGAADVLRIQGLAMIASFVLAGWSFGLLSMERYVGLFVANAVALVVSCTLTVTLAAAHGAQGAAIATVCGEFSLAVVSFLALVRGHPNLRPRVAFVLKVLLAAAPAVALALLPDVSSLLRALLALAIYGFMVTLTRAVPAELLELLPGRIRGGR